MGVIICVSFLLLYYNSQCLQAEAHPSLAHSNPNPKTNHI